MEVVVGWEDVLMDDEMSSKDMEKSLAFIHHPLNWKMYGINCRHIRRILNNFRLHPFLPPQFTNASADMHGASFSTSLAPNFLQIATRCRHYARDCR